MSGARDDRPLRGRDSEQRELAAALADPKVRLVIATGAAGVGKTALLRQALERMRPTGALTGAGKHVEGGDSDDLAPLMTALSGAVDAGLDQLYDPESGVTVLASAVGPYGAAFADVGSGVLRNLAGPAAPTAMPPEAAEERLAQAVMAVIEWLDGFDQPIVLLIDDWGRASPRAARLYNRLLLEPGLPRLRLFASERPSEPSEAADGVRAVRIEISPLGPDAVLALIKDLLDAPLAFDPSDLLDQLAGSEIPFDVIQSVQLLIAAGALEHGAKGWRLQKRRVQAALGGSATLGLATRLMRLGDQPLRAAGILAVIGDSAPWADFAAICEAEEVDAAEAVQDLERAGILRVDGEQVRLSHDRMRAAVLERLSPAERQGLAGRCAEVMLGEGLESGAGGRVSAILSLRLQGGLDSLEAGQWPHLFARGSRAARGAGDLSTATSFAGAALHLSDRVGLDDTEILTEAVLAAVQQMDHERAQLLATRLVAAATDAKAQAEADEIRVFACRMSGDLDKALEVGLEAGRRVGVTAPKRPTQLGVMAEAMRVVLSDPRRARRYKPYTDAELDLLAPRLRVAHAAGTLLHERNARQAIIFGSRVASGRLMACTALGASIASFICALTGAYAKAADWAEISDRLQGPNQPLRASAMQNAIDFGHWYRRPLAETARRNDEVEALAYAEGDLAAAGYANRNRVLDTLFLDQPLGQVARTARRGLTIAQRLQDKSTRPVIAAVLQMTENLSNPQARSSVLSGEHYQDVARGGAYDDSEAHLNNLYRPIGVVEALLADMYGDYATAAAIYDRRAATFESNIHHPRTPFWIFATALALYRTGRKPPRHHLRIMRLVARLNPHNYGRRLLLLEAEAARVAGNSALALRKYEAASALAEASDCLLDRGLISQAAAEAAELLGATAAAEGFRARAREAWIAFGAANLLPDPADAELSSRATAGRSGDNPARELELAAARDAAERANRAKSRLLAAVGHELRTPLQGISGLLELASPATPLDISVLRGAVAQLSTVVGDLTDLGALDANALALAQAPFDPASLARGVIAVHEPSLRPSGRRIVLMEPGTGARLVGDEGRIRQILSNLLSNAVNYGGGEITVRLDLTPGGSDRISVVLEVRDQGEGLSATDLVHLFEPFERGEAAARVAGLGLGLSIARRLAVAMGGDLTARSAPGEGAAFRLTLESPEAPAAASTPHPAASGRHVLLAEDTPLSRRVLRALLEAEGCRVREAQNGEDALALARSQPFDLLLLDMRMPVMTGLDVARAVRADAGLNSATPIAMITASRDAALEAASVDLRLQGVVQKPLDRGVLRGLLLALDTGEWPGSARSEPKPLTSRLRELEDAMGIEAAAALLRELQPSVRGALARLLRAVAAGEASEAAQDAHRLAGLLANFGLDREAAAVRQVERSLLNGAPQIDGGLARDLTRLVDQIDWGAFEAFADRAAAGVS